MEPAHAPSFYKEALIVLGAAGVVIPLVQRLRFSPVLGYMLVGMAVGPFGLGALTGHFPWLSAVTLTDRAAIEPIAELGVVLLLFMIGLELSFERLWLMRRLVFGLGAAQVALCAVALAGIAIALGRPSGEAAVVGIALAMSSTAVVLQVLSDEKRINTPTGRASFAVLLFQDLSVVPVLFALGALAPNSHAAAPPVSPWRSARRCWQSPPSSGSAAWCCARCSAPSPARAARSSSSPPACWW